MNERIGFTFPINDGGQLDGINHAGMETFRAEKEKATAKETIQNDLDAHCADSGEPVKVIINLEYLTKKGFPGYKEHIKTLNLCEESITNIHGNNEKTRKFIEKAKKVFNKDYIPFLVISDYNTTGLIGADSENGGVFCKLTKGAGSSNKTGQAGGSYGIGKNAPFILSDIRSVFYSSKDINGVYGFQGVSRWISHKNENGQLTQGTGYYGVKENKMPIVNECEIYNFFKREETGTSIFIPGFNGDENWKQKMIIAVIDSFFVAVMEKKLVVEIDDIIIDNSTIGNIIKDIKKSKKNWITAYYYEAMTSDDKKHFTIDIDGMGDVELFVLKGDQHSSKVAMIRGNGIKITDKRFRLPLKYYGVMIARGKQINEFLRECEPPAHDDWKGELYEDDPKYAKKVLKNLYQAVKEKIKSIIQVKNFEELNVECISEYFPDDLEFGKGESEQGEKNIPIKEVKIKKRIFNKSKQSKKVAANIIISNGDEEYKKNRGNVGGEDGEQYGDGKKNKNSRTINVQESEEGEQNDKKTKKIRFNYTRVFCIDESIGKYKVIIKALNKGTTNIDFNIDGEVEKYKASIKEAVIAATGESINVLEKGKIGPISFKAGEKKSIVITLENPMVCALEVSSNEN